MGRFEGKGVIVTGAGRGIGQATAQRFASEGADVMLIGRTPLPLEETAELIHGEGGKRLGAPVRRARRRRGARRRGRRASRAGAGASTCSSTTPASTTRRRSSR